MATFQIRGDFAVENLEYNMSSRSCLAKDPRALRKVGGSVEAHAVDSCVFLHKGVGFAFIGGEGSGPL